MLMLCWVGKNKNPEINSGFSFVWLKTKGNLKIEVELKSTNLNLKSKGLDQ